MIYTVFRKDEDLLPQDFSNYEDAKAYGDSLCCDYEIEWTSGEVV